MMLPPDPRTIDLSNLPGVVTGFDPGLANGGIGMDDLTQRIRARLEDGDDEAIRQALAWQGPPALNALLWQALQTTLDAAAAGALRLRLFALPIILVAGTRQPSRAEMVLNDTKAVIALFESAGALGPNQQFGLSAGLCAENALRDLAWSQLYQQCQLQVGEQAPLSLPPEDLELPEGQSVHLRFLVGNTLLAAGAPEFRETAGDIGRWGGALTRLLAVQLAAPGVTLLPLARTPQGLAAAWKLGRFCRQEVACQLALGDALRDMRARAGDPSVRISSSHDDSVAVELESPWTGERVTHRWRLHPETDLVQVIAAIHDFLSDCGLAPAQIESFSQ